MSVLMCMPVIMSGGNAAVDVAAVVLVAAGGETVAVVPVDAADVVAVVPVVPLPVPVPLDNIFVALTRLNFFGPDSRRYTFQYDGLSNHCTDTGSHDGCLLLMPVSTLGGEVIAFMGAALCTIYIFQVVSIKRPRYRECHGPLVAIRVSCLSAEAALSTLGDEAMK